MRDVKRRTAKAGLNQLYARDRVGGREMHVACACLGGVGCVRVWHARQGATFLLWSKRTKFRVCRKLKRNVNQSNASDKRHCLLPLSVVTIIAPFSLRSCGGGCGGGGICGLTLGLLSRNLTAIATATSQDPACHSCDGLWCVNLTLARTASSMDFAWGLVSLASS